MPMWLGEASEHVKSRLHELDPFMREHAADGARRYFQQFRADEARLTRGPAIESMFEFFIGPDASVEVEEVWIPERSTEVLAYLQIKYALMVMETYNQLLLSLRSEVTKE